MNKEELIVVAREAGADVQEGSTGFCMVAMSPAQLAEFAERIRVTAAPQEGVSELSMSMFASLEDFHKAKDADFQSSAEFVKAAPQPPASAPPATGNVGADAWRGPFWDVARALNCLPSTFPDANDHVLREAKRFAALRCLKCNGHGLVGCMTMEGGEGHECPDCHGSGAALPPPGRGMVPMTDVALAAETFLLCLDGYNHACQVDGETPGGADELVDSAEASMKDARYTLVGEIFATRQRAAK